MRVARGGYNVICVCDACVRCLRCVWSVELCVGYTKGKPLYPLDGADATAEHREMRGSS